MQQAVARAADAAPHDPRVQLVWESNREELANIHLSMQQAGGGAVSN